MAVRRFALCLIGPILAAGISFGLIVESASGEGQIPGPVFDRSGVLNPAMTVAISDWLESYRKRTGNQVSVVVLEDLQGRSLEDWGAQMLAEDTSGIQRTVVLLVAPKDHEATIAVGGGLKSRLTSDQAASIIAADLRSGFTVDRLAGGILKSIADILDVLDNGRNSRVRPEPGAVLLTKIVDGWPLLLLFVVLILGASFLRTRYRRAVGKRLHGEAVDVDTGDPASIWWNDEIRRK